MKRKSGFLAFVLWCGGLFLLAGLHRFYVGRFWTGLLWFCTLGLFGIGQLIDLFRLGDMVRVANSEGVEQTRTPTSATMVAPVFNVTVNAVPGGMPIATADQSEPDTTHLLSSRRA